MDCSAPVFPVHHQLLELAEIHVHWVGDAIQPSHPLLSPSPAFNLSQLQGLFFIKSQFFASGGQSIGASASASVFPMYIQGWFPLGLTGCGWVSESKCHMVWWGSVLGDQSLVVLWQAKSHQDETSPVYSLIILQSGLCWTWGCPPGKTHFYSSFAHIALCGGEHKALSHVICL